MHIGVRAASLAALAWVTSVAFADEAAVREGQAVYSQTCVACHGPDGKGTIPGVADLTQKSGALSKTDEELIRSITDGAQGPTLAMPAKGGNPTLTAENVRTVIAYLRATFQRQ